MEPEDWRICEADYTLVPVGVDHISNVVLGLSFTRFFPPMENNQFRGSFLNNFGSFAQGFSRSSSSDTVIRSIVVLRLARTL